jgi:hypothetical protein
MAVLALRELRRPTQRRGGGIVRAPGTWPRAPMPAAQADRVAAQLCPPARAHRIFSTKHIQQPTSNERQRNGNYGKKANHGGARGAHLDTVLVAQPSRLRVPAASRCEDLLLGWIHAAGRRLNSQARTPAVQFHHHNAKDSVKMRPARAGV